MLAQLKLSVIEGIDNAPIAFKLSTKRRRVKQFENYLSRKAFLTGAPILTCVLPQNMTKTSIAVSALFEADFALILFKILRARSLQIICIVCFLFKFPRNASLEKLVPNEIMAVLAQNHSIR
mmetsp:Transcript_15755/g.36475  ORF Transcript_15755/g.36475 Transcript_15755/m.36475 type:complete len:122 (-) Transcript_15755:436-801(-)